MTYLNHLHYQKDTFSMIASQERKLSLYAEAAERRHKARVQSIIDITNQEVTDQLGITETEHDPTKDVIYNIFVGNSSGMYSLTGFLPDEFEKLWCHVEEKFSAPSRGRRPSMSLRDILMVVLHFLRRYPRVEEAAAIFQLKPSTLQSIITKYVPIMASALKHDLIDSVAAEDIVYDQRFPDCGYVVDATVQEIYKPALNFEIAKKYFSGKHYIYCLKSQVIVNIKGLAVHIVTSIPGAKHDKNVFDSNIHDFEKIIALHPDQPKKILADKGYQDPNSAILVTPVKGNSADLTREQLTFNENLGEVRIIVENFFGRVKSRYEIMSSVFRGSHDTYADIFTVCCALVNFEQIECNHGLRACDHKFYVRLQASIKAKKKEADEKAKEKRKQQARLRRRIFGMMDPEEQNENEG